MSSASPTPEGNEELGQQVGHRFRILDPIARGGMASVYKAIQEGVGRTVALKILRVPDDAETGADFDARFRNEARALASLNHPHIVTLYDFGELTDGRCFLAMEYIDGPRLTDLLRDGPLQPERAIRLMTQVCKALRYAHHRGVVHRDLKPSNLMVRQIDDGTEHVKVVDFGLVKLMDTDQEITRAGLVLGSPHCMAPEQITGQGVGPETDVYAVGILLYRSVLGRYPFHGNNGTATMIAHLHNPIPPFTPERPDTVLPDGLETVIRRCLEKDPTSRYRSMDELLRALSSIIDLPVDPFVTTTTHTQATLRMKIPPQPPPVAGWSMVERAMIGGALMCGLLGGLSAVAWWTLSSAGEGSAAVEAPASNEAVPAAVLPPAQAGAAESAPSPGPPQAPTTALPATPAAASTPTTAPAAATADARPRATRPATPPPEKRPTKAQEPPPPAKKAPPDGYKDLPSDW